MNKCQHGMTLGFCIQCQIEKIHNDIDNVLSILGADIEK